MLHKDLSKQFGLQHDEESHEKSSNEEQYFDPNQSKKKKIIFWLYLFVLLGFIIAVLTLVSKSYKPVSQLLVSDNFYFSNQVVSEWKKGFVTEIKVVNATVSPDCPAGYEHAFTYKWRGTGFGCLCQSGQNTTFVLEAYCSPALIQANCTNLASQAQRQTYYWKNNANICIKRSTVSFANEAKYDSTNKICGSSQSLVVVPSSEPCPLVNVSMTLFSLEEHIYTATDSDNLLPKIYAAYNSTSPYSFYSYPVNKFTVSQYQFCQINEDTGLSPNHTDFVLLTIPKGCAQEGNFSQIDQTTELDFYNNNPNLHALTQIKGFPEAGNWYYKFGFASTPSWTYRCRHNLNKKFSISNASKQFNFQIYSFLSAGTWIMITCTIIIAVEIFLLGLRRCVNNSIYPVGYKQQHLPQYFWWSMSRYIIDVICKILILVFGGLFALNGYQDWHWFKEVQNYKCHHDSIELIEYIILPFSKIHFMLFNNGLAVFVITIVMIVVDAFHFYYIYNNELAFYLVDSNRPLVNKDDAENKLDSIQKLNDLKWLEVDNVEQLQPNKNDDQLRITMAQDLFANEETIASPSKPTRGKKKGPTKKTVEKNIQKSDKPPAYLFDDDMFGIDNIDEPTEAILKQSPKKKINNRRKKK